MAGSFNFSQDTFTSSDFLNLTQLSTGDASGTVNNDAHFSAIAASQFIDFTNDRDVLAIALHAGQEYTFDIDDGDGDGDPVDVEVTIVDSGGLTVGKNDDGGVLDPGSFSKLDSLVKFTPVESGVYFVTVTHFDDDYVS